MHSNQPLINATVNFVKQTLQDAEAGHDWWHILRVWNNAKLLAKTEPANLLVVELAALLHDIADSKFNNGNEDIGPQTAHQFLTSQGADAETIQQVVYIISNLSFKNELDGHVAPKSIELQVVQDADRLDAIGAIGIARAFTYGGFKNRLLYHPDIAPNLSRSKEAYKSSNAPTINHFYEKLLLLKDRMNTTTARQVATQRHQFMEQYLQQFYTEWNGLG
jgi:uncharacterized protein